MSNAGLAPTTPANQDGVEQRQGRPVLALLLAFVLATLVGVIALRLHGQWRRRCSWCSVLLPLPD